ncbi:MAG: HAMP domain-containing histidine kinase [Proteobacteria bacterium]|nr:HAMP domain-containing histidine kinase [Pseudomonadota bacterium]
MMESGVSAARPEAAMADAVGAGERRAPPEDRTGDEAGALGPLRFLACIGALSFATMTADLSVAAGVAGGVVHLAVVLLGWWARKPAQVVARAAFASLLVLAGFALRFEEAVAQVAAVDRVIALLAIWGAAALLVAVKRREIAQGRGRRALAARVRDQAAALAATQTHAELAQRSRSEFFAQMGHELRTPLNAIIGFSEIIKDEIFGPVGSARYREYLHDINESGHHLLDLVNDLMDIAKLEFGKIALEEAPVALSELIRACVAEAAGAAQAGGVALETGIPDDLAQLRADGRKLRQILDNLLSNAVKFTAPGGTVKVSAWSSADAGLVLQVADDGIGMALKDIPVALSPFGQIENPLRQRHEGSGLGLPLTKALVELHAGSFDLQSEPGVGTKVTLRFPPERVIAVSKVA